jgi:hypothetical protein
MQFEKTLKATEMIEGKGARVKRILPIRSVDPQDGQQKAIHCDPFVLCDHFMVAAPSGFAMHPHQGFEAITYLFDGKFRHQDNFGNDETIGPGDAQRFSAGPGFEHSEMPVGETQAEGIQLWIKHAASDYEKPSSYQAVKSSSLLKEEAKGVSRRVICDAKSKLSLRTEVVFEDLSFDDEAEYFPEMKEGNSGFVYVVHGEVFANEVQITTGHSVHWHESGKLRLHARAPSRAVLIMGRPRNEPIILHGSFVKRGR